MRIAGSMMSWNIRGASGGILAIWEVSRFSMEVVDRNFILIQGTWLKEDIMCCILAVYALCDGRNQARFWDSILHWEFTFPGPWYFAEDFNSVLHNEERSGCSVAQHGGYFCELC
ncbi:hypothetical protein V6N11_012679 [Hibiscus sabdariffa]|uniref:Uncharacterized protein n=2 Tax=Hibiscus sabdariffa TaxID=183260 RepID=A0ABR2QBU7_9ROSI